MNGLTDLNPLTEEHLASIDRGLAQIERARQQINLAKAAGIDVTADEARMKASEEQLRRIRAVYFPNR